MAEVGSIVFYALTSDEAAVINAQREVYKENEPPHGVTIHLGANVAQGSAFPMMVTIAQPDGALNGQVFLDGNDQLWVRNASEGAGAGQWQATYTAPPQPPAGDPTETGILQWPLAETDTDVPLTTPPTTVVVGSILKIESEYTTVTDVSNVDNPKVTRGSFATAVVAHAQGVEVSIWGTPVDFVTTATATKYHPKKK